MEVVVILLIAAVVVYSLWPSKNKEQVDEPDEVQVSESIDIEEKWNEVIAEAVERSLPDFGKMTKVQIEEWARANIDLELDRRKTKANMIADVRAKLDIND